jgi:hypothetical protein
VGSYISEEKMNLYVNDHPKAAFSYPANASWLAKTEKLNATGSADDIGIALYSFVLDNRTDFASQLVLCSSSWKNCTFDTLKQDQCANESLACFLKLNVTDSYGLRNITVLTVGIDNKQPRVNLIAPANNSVTGKTVKFRYIPIDRNLDDCILYHNASGWKANLSNTTVISGIQQTFTIGLRNGVFKWNVWCNDTKGNSAFNRTNYTVFVDGLPPKVMLVAPANNSWNWENATFYYNVSDVLSNITNCSLVINDKLNVTSNEIDKDTTLYFILHNLAQADYYWRVNCTDFFGNQNSSAQRRIRIDTTGPVSILDRPRNFTNVSSDYLKLNASAVDTGVGNIAIVRFEYRQNVSSAWNYACLDTDHAMPFNCTWNITGLPDSNQYQLRVFANDSLGNSGAANVHVNITVDRKPPTVMLVMPQNNAQDTDGNVLLEYNVTDQTSLIKNCSLILNGKLNTTSKAVTKGITQSFQLNGLAQANYTWQVGCVDYALNKNFSNTRNLTVAPDTTPPVVMLISPKNHSIYTRENVVFVFNVTDELSGIQNCTLILNYRKNQSLKSVAQAVPQQFVQTLSDGNYTWRVNCTDNSTGYYNVGGSAIFNLTVRKATAIIVNVYGYYTLYETGEQAFFRTNTSDVYANKMDTNLTIFIINRSVSLPWWNSSFRYRKELNITRNQTTLLANSTINFTFNTQTLISQSKMRSDGLDLRIAWFNNHTNSWQELDRLVYNINSPSTTVMFKTQANLTVSDSNYYVYYGNSSMTDAPVDKSGIYLYYDNFDSDTLSTYSKTAAFTQPQEDTDNIFRYNSTKKWINVISNSSKGKSLRKSFPSAKDVVVEADQYLEKDQGVYSKLELAARVDGLAYYTFFASSNIIYSALLRYNSTGQGTQLDSVNQQFGTKGVWRHLKFMVYDNATGVVLKAYVDSTKLFEDVDSSSKQLSSSGGFGTGEYQLVGRMDNITVRRYLSRKPLSSIGAEETLVYHRTNATGPDGTDYFKWNTTKQALSNYTIVSLASNPDYRNGYGYYQFRIGPHVLPPQITLKLPVNGENLTNASLMFSWIADDRVDTNVSCNLTINGIVRAKVPTLYEVQTNYSYSNLVEGFNYWNVTCIDKANNANTSKRWSFVVVMAPRYFSAILAENNRSVVLNWSNVTYADYFAVYIGKNYSYFYSNPNATLKQLNWTDQNSAGDIKKFYRLAVMRGKVKKFHNDTVGKHVILLYPEWNMVSLPLVLKNYVLKNATNEGYNPQLSTKGCITEIWRYNSTRTSVWEETLYESGYWNPASGSGNFTTLSPYSGYWFYNNLTFNCNYTVVGTIARKNTTVHLNQNYNLVGWHSEDSPALPTDCAPAYPLQVSPVNSIKYTYYYDSILDSFGGAMHFEYSGCSNNDWGWWPSTYPSSLISWEPTKGYYLKTTQIADWTLVSLK